MPSRQLGAAPRPPPAPGAAALAALRRGVRGAVLAPGDPGYDDARRVYNGRVDRRPAVVVRCAGTADVLAGLRFARGEGLPLAVRGGGHSAAGHGVCDGGGVLDLSPMKGVRVDPPRRTVRAQAGLTWGELDHETQAWGLATTGARISSTGIAGVTLGGGYGWLMRRQGLAVDNLLAVDLVTAEGRVVRAAPDEEPELFWGVRGGGGNFGVATALEYRLHAVGPLVTGGMAFYPVARAAEVLRVYRALMADAPDDLCALCNFLLLPPAPFVPPHLVGSAVAAVAVCHAGTAAEARRDLDPLRALGEPLIDRIGLMPYLRLQRMYDAAGVFGRRVHGRSGHLATLDDGAVEALAAHGARVRSPFSIVMVSSLGGAVARVGEEETAFGHRRARFDVAVTAVWEDPADTDRQVAWAEEAWAAVGPRTRGVYVNELGDEGEARVREAYTPRAWRRLRVLKAAWDPGNVFRLNQNIPPAPLERRIDMSTTESARSPAPAAAALAGARVGFLILYVYDVAESREFYERRLGLRVIEADEDSVKLDAGRVILSLHRASDYGVTLAGRRDDASDVVFLVDDLNAVRAELEARGVSFIRRRTYEIGRVTDFYDPNGHRLMIYEPSATALSWPSAEKLRAVWRACGKGAAEPIGPASAPAGAGGLDGKPLVYLFLFVPSSAEADAFYEGDLGLPPVERVHCCNPACPPEEKGIAKYDVGGMLLTTHHIHRSPVVDDFGRVYSPRALDPEHTRGIAPVFLVHGLAEVAERLGARGVRFTQGPVRSQIGEVARFEAPTGHPFFLYEPAAEVLKWPAGAKVEEMLA